MWMQFYYGQYQFEMEMNMCEYASWSRSISDLFRLLRRFVFIMETIVENYMEEEQRLTEEPMFLWAMRFYSTLMVYGISIICE